MGKVTMCDPPAGWRYGFPRPIPEDRKNDMVNWLLECGYPQSEIDACGKYFHCRMWEESEHV